MTAASTAVHGIVRTFAFQRAGLRDFPVKKPKGNTNRLSPLRFARRKRHSSGTYSGASVLRFRGSFGAASSAELKVNCNSMPRVCSDVTSREQMWKGATSCLLIKFYDTSAEWCQSWNIQSALTSASRQLNNCRTTFQRIMNSLGSSSFLWVDAGINDSVTDFTYSSRGGPPDIF